VNILRKDIQFYQKLKLIWFFFHSYFYIISILSIILTLVSLFFNNKLNFIIIILSLIPLISIQIEFIFSKFIYFLFSPFIIILRVGMISFYTWHVLCAFLIRKEREFVRTPKKGDKLSIYRNQNNQNENRNGYENNEKKRNCLKTLSFKKKRSHYLLIIFEFIWAISLALISIYLYLLKSNQHQVNIHAIFFTSFISFCTFINILYTIF